MISVFCKSIPVFRSLVDSFSFAGFDFKKAHGVGTCILLTELWEIVWIPMIDGSRVLEEAVGKVGEVLGLGACERAFVDIFGLH